MKRKYFSLAGARTNESDYFCAAQYLGCKPVILNLFYYLKPSNQGGKAMQNSHQNSNYLKLLLHNIKLYLDKQWSIIRLFPNRNIIFFKLNRKMSITYKLFEICFSLNLSSDPGIILKISKKIQDYEIEFANEV